MLRHRTHKEKREKLNQSSTQNDGAKPWEITERKKNQGRRTAPGASNRKKGEPGEKSGERKAKEGEKKEDIGDAKSTSIEKSRGNPSRRKHRCGGRVVESEEEKTKKMRAQTSRRKSETMD